MPQKQQPAGATKNGAKVGGQFTGDGPKPEGAPVTPGEDERVIAKLVPGTEERPLPVWNQYNGFYDPTSAELIDHDGYIDVRDLPEFAEDERVFYDGRDTIVVEKQFDFTTLAPAGLSGEEKLDWCEQNSYHFYSHGKADGGYYPVDEPDTWDAKWWGVRAEVGDVADDTEDQFGLPTAPELLDRVKADRLVERIRSLHAKGPSALDESGRLFPKG